MRNRLEDLYLDACERTGWEPAQDQFDRWLHRCELIASGAIGQKIKVNATRRERRRGGLGLARRVILTGTIKAVWPERVHCTATTAAVVWGVELESGRKVYVRRLPG